MATATTTKTTTAKQTATRKGKKNYTPAAWCVEQFGGVRAMAKAIKKNPGTVSRWATSGSGQSAGTIPSSALKTVLKTAQKKKLDITAEDLIMGRKH